MGLKTEPFRVARSGSTIDGREIKPEMLTQAAKNYDRETYTAVIWPDHQRYYNLGVVDSVSVQKNSHGGIDLYAVLEPNGFYQDNLKYGQRLFTSVELMPDFAKTGEWYLSGLAATDSPASLGTEEVKFSLLPDAKNLYSAFIEASVDVREDPAVAFFKQLFNKLTTPKEYDMTKEELDALNASIEELKAGFTALKPTIDEFSMENSAETDTGDANAELQALTAENADLKEKVTALESTVTDIKTQFGTLETQLLSVSTQLTEALKEQPGTNSEQHSSDKKLADFA